MRGIGRREPLERKGEGIGRVVLPGVRRLTTFPTGNSINPTVIIPPSAPRFPLETSTQNVTQTGQWTLMAHVSKMATSGSGWKLQEGSLGRRCHRWITTGLA